MPTDFSITATTDRQYNCVTTQQKAVYNWYETRHSDDDVVDIYSPEWQRRIKSWHTWFIETHGADHEHSETVKLREAPEDLDFRSFFFEHPVATYSLWHVFQAFYDFDEAVCGTSSEAKETLESWKKLKPFEYLKSEDVQRRWKDDLKKMDTEIGYRDLSGEELKSRMYNILRAVERIETALDSLEDDFKFDYHEIKTVEWVLDTVTDAFDKRCLMIAKLLQNNANVPPSYEVIVSDPGIDSTLTGSLGADPPPPAEHHGYYHQLLFLMDLFNLRVSSIVYVVLCIALVFLSLNLVSALEGLEILSRNYE